jgi:hypothetical protein
VIDEMHVILTRRGGTLEESVGVVDGREAVVYDETLESFIPGTGSHC